MEMAAFRSSLHSSTLEPVANVECGIRLAPEGMKGLLNGCARRARHLCNGRRQLTELQARQRVQLFGHACSCGTCACGRGDAGACCMSMGAKRASIAVHPNSNTLNHVHRALG